MARRRKFVPPSSASRDGFVINLERRRARVGARLMSELASC